MCVRECSLRVQSLWWYMYVSVSVSGEFWHFFASVYLTSPNSFSFTFLPLYFIIFPFTYFSSEKNLVQTPCQPLVTIPVGKIFHIFCIPQGPNFGERHHFYTYWEVMLARQFNSGLSSRDVAMKKSTENFTCKLSMYTKGTVISR